MKIYDAKVYLGTKQVLGNPMTRLEYNNYRGWGLPDGEDGSDEGYLIEYLNSDSPNDHRHNGYISWSPKATFEDAYVEISEGFSFGEAIRQAKAGRKVSRKGWNGKGMWVIYNPGSKGQTHPMFNGSVYKEHGVGECVILPHFDMYTVNAEGRRAMLPGWVASQSDMDASDWSVVSN